MVEVDKIECSGHEHYKYTAYDDVFALPVDTVYKSMFTGCDVNKKYNNERQAPDLQQTPWTKDEASGNEIRELQYDITVKTTIGTKKAGCQEKQTLHSYSKPGEMYIVDANVTNSGLPYTDKFYIANRSCITRISARETRLRVTCEVFYVKSVLGFIKSLVEKNTYAGMTENYKLLDRFIREVEDKADIPRNRSVGVRSRSVRFSKNQRNSTNIKVPLSTSTHELRRTSSFTEKVVYVLVVTLVLFNAVLFYKLSALETLASHLHEDDEHDISSDLSIEVATEDQNWMNLLEMERNKHILDVNHWEHIVTAIEIQTRQILVTLEELDADIITTTEMPEHWKTNS